MPARARRARRPCRRAVGLEGAQARDRDPLLPGKLANLLPTGTYRFANAPHDAGLAALAFLLGLYRFSRYRAAGKAPPSLVAPPEVDGARLERIAKAIAFGRDLVNTPANDLGPTRWRPRRSPCRGFWRQNRDHARRDLLSRNLPLIHAVGRAAARRRVSFDFIWGRNDAPKSERWSARASLFDTGGLDIKPASAMEIMKKDMGGRRPPP